MLGWNSVYEIFIRNKLPRVRVKLDDPFSRRISLRLLTIIWMSLLPVFAAGPQPVRGKNGVVASRSLIASEVGIEIMKQGGNAIDAAVAVGFALAVTYPSAGNLGGGGFMVIHLADGKVLSLDYRETAPKASTRDMYLDESGNVIKGLSTQSHKAAGTPGSVAGLLEALEKYGTLSREKVLAPAIRLASQGFPLNYDLARQFKRQQRFMEKYPSSLAVFTKKGEPYEADDLWVQPDLAETLRRISTSGRDGFYLGKTADLIVAEMARGGGLVSHEDLKNYLPKWREPLLGTYRGYQIISMPPPSSGGALVIQMLNMLEPYKVKESGWGSAETIHLMIEAQRRAYADRAEHLGDPDFFDVPLKKLMSKEYAKTRFADYQPGKASLSEDIGAGTWGKESPETTHYSVMDGKGNAVSVTTTLNWGYGSKIVVSGAGFLLNNEMDDFSVKANTPNTFGLIGRKANEIQPNKRMLSSMTPTIVTKDGKVVLVTGSPGGATIINTVFQVVVNTIDHEMSISNAVSLPRFHHQWQPNRIIYEPYGFSPDTLSLLKLKGHINLIEARWRLGDANSIAVEDEYLLGMSDPRNDGGAAAY